jgi:hypothetical protein
LELDTTLERQVSSGQWHEYRFTLRSGEYAGLLLEQRSINVAVECYGPDDKLRFTADSYGTGENEPLELIGDVDGPYRLRVTAPDRHAPLGRYAITLRTVEAAF